MLIEGDGESRGTERRTGATPWVDQGPIPLGQRWRRLWLRRQRGEGSKWSHDGWFDGRSGRSQSSCSPLRLAKSRFSPCSWLW